MTASSQPIALLFDSFGPYHLARLQAAQARLTVVGLEIGGRSDDYPWFGSPEEEHARLVRLFPGDASSAVAPRALRRAVSAALDRIDPATVAVPGWGTVSALAALDWCARRRRPAIMMCDSTAIDAQRNVALETLKRAIVGSCAAGFASGERSTAYLSALGLDRARTSTGYDVVDNRHFAAAAEAARRAPEPTRAALGLPVDYILSVGRLVAKKNLEGLVHGYARYVARVGEHAAPLVIAGGGPLDAALRAQVATLGLGARVTFVGHVDYADLPAVYALARCFALVSRVEQWGLVVNEAIACGLPVLVSDRCGASADLLEPGVNGVLCSPEPDAIAEGLHALLEDSDLAAMGAASRRIADAWGLDRFVDGLARADTLARGGRAPRRLPVAIAAALRTLAA